MTESTLIKTLPLELYQKYGLDDPVFMDLLTHMNTLSPTRRGDLTNSDNVWFAMAEVTADWCQEHGVSRETLYEFCSEVGEYKGNATRWIDDIVAIDGLLYDRWLETNRTKNV